MSRRSHPARTWPPLQNLNPDLLSSIVSKLSQGINTPSRSSSRRMRLPDMPIRARLVLPLAVLLCVASVVVSQTDSVPPAPATPAAPQTSAETETVHILVGRSI